MPPKISKELVRSARERTFFKEGDIVEAAVKLGKGIPAGKAGVVVTQLGFPPNEGYEVDFRHTGLSLQVLPNQISLKVPVEKRKDAALFADSVPDFKANEMTALKRLKERATSQSERQSEKCKILGARGDPSGPFSSGVSYRTTESNGAAGTPCREL